MDGFTRNLIISSVALSFNATTTVGAASLDMITNDRPKKNQEALLQWSADKQGILQYMGKWFCYLSPARTPSYCCCRWFFLKDVKS